MKKRTGSVSRFGLLVGMVLLLLIAADGRGADPEKRVVFDLNDQADVPAGEPFARWAAANGWRSPLGDPRYFFITSGRLHLVSKPGPVYDNRFWLAVRDREKLKDQIENKVLVQITPENFRITPEEYPVIGFEMSPEQLPAAEADLRDPDKNDAAFYLLVSFDTETQGFQGFELPQSIAYVWANRRWTRPVAGDPDYDAFMRYIPIGYGSAKLGKDQVVKRHVPEDFRMAYPDLADVPDVIGISLMIDSNTLGGTAESTLSRIWFEAR